MKKIITERVREDSKYFCDVHPNRECFSGVNTTSWYGSEFDLMGAEFHLCDECLKEFYAHLKQKYNVEPKELSLL